MAHSSGGWKVGQHEMQASGMGLPAGASHGRKLKVKRGRANTKITLLRGAPLALLHSGMQSPHDLPASHSGPTSQLVHRGLGSHHMSCGGGHVQGLTGIDYLFIVLLIFQAFSSVKISSPLQLCLLSDLHL